jgi:hypothetical protein
MIRLGLTGVVTMTVLALGGCKDKAKDADTSGPAGSAKTTKAETAPPTPSWVDNVTGEKFKAWVEGHPNGCDCDVVSFKNDGGTSVITWQIHKAGDDHYAGFVTTVSGIGGKTAGAALAASLETKFPGCIRNEVGNKVIVSTRLVARSGSGVYRNGKHEVKACSGDFVSLPDGLERHFAN